MLIINDEKILRKISLPCESYEEGLEIANKLKEEVKNHKALGLSAPQIGIFKRVFIVWGSTGVLNAPPNWNVYINPELDKEEDEKMFYEEGCLSFPGITVLTHRPKQITASSLGEDGQMYQYVLDGEDSIVFQHEFDHLNGRLMFDGRAKSVPQEYNRGKDKVGRNDLCPCGSGKKYKKCCGR